MFNETLEPDVHLQESTEPTDENKEASLVKALAPPSLQEAVRTHSLKASYKAARMRVEQADEQSLYMCTVETGCRNKGAQPDVQVGTTSDHTVAIITQVHFVNLWDWPLW